jgi:phosphoserine phosphatase RsbU/P
MFVSDQMDARMDTTLCGFLSFADDGTILAINATLSELLGYSVDGLTGQKLDVILTLASRIFYQTHFFPLLKLKGKAEEIYFSLRSKSGQDRPMLVNGIRLEQADRSVNDCMFIPISQRIQYEDHILQAKKLAESTLELTQKQAEITLRQQYERSLLLQEITHQIRQSLNSQEIFSTAANKIGWLFQVDRCLIYAYAAVPMPQLTLVAEFSADEHITSLVKLTIPILGNTHVERMMAQDQVLESPDVFADPLLQAAVPVCHQIGLKSMLAVRTSYQGQPNGAIEIHQCDRFRQWKDWEIELLQAVSNQLSIAIQQANLYSQLQLELRERQRAEQIIRQQADREIVLRKMTQQIHQSLDLADVLQVATQEIRQCFKADRVGVFKFHPDSHFTAGEFIAESVEMEFASVMGPTISDHCLGEQYGAGYPQERSKVIVDIEQAAVKDCYRNLMRKLQIRSNLVVPLLKSGELWGLLCVHQCAVPRDWQAFEIDFVQQIAYQLAIAIQQADLFQKLQQELLERKLTEARLTQSNEELAHTTRLLGQLVNTDGLTQIANRRCFNERLEQEWRRLCREHQPLALLLFDVDYFKRYNDAYGHQLGDECLIKLAQAVQEILCRPADLLARYGGEEFVVLLPNTDLAGAIAIAERIHRAVQTLNMPHKSSDVSPIVTVSLGIATALPVLGAAPTDLIQQSDQALYWAKQHGRNQSALLSGSGFKRC